MYNAFIRKKITSCLIFVSALIFIPPAYEVWGRRWYTILSLLVIWSFWVKAVQNSKSYGDLPLGLVAMATESSHRLIMGKWLNCIFSITSEVM